MNANAHVSGQEGEKARAQADLSDSGEGEGDLRRSAFATTTSPAAATNDVAPGRVLLGARHDLKLDGDKSTARCQCLAVALGDARDGGMLWSAGPPQLDAGTQLSIALSSEGQACQDEPPQSLGASYWGYRITGDDVVVLVEAARAGRPLTSGAIIPKPVGQGQVFIAPASSKLPYGRSPEGKGLCRIGNPGQQRSAPFSGLEIGADAPRPASGAVTRRAVTAGPSQLDDMPSTLEIQPY